MTSAATQTAVASHPADRLLDAIDRLAAPVCVGLDPVVERLPAALRPAKDDARSSTAALREYSLGVLDAIAPNVPCVKFQSACFERYRHLGVQALYELISAARSRGLQVILDAKRGDIGVSAEHYAAAAFDPWRDAVGKPQADERPDWLTINSYLGADGIEPFLRPGFGAFALVRTSNPGGDALQSQLLAGGRTVAEFVAEIVADVGKASVGRRGYSALGAVVGATKPVAAARLRQLMPQQIFLVPGFGAQGAGVDQVLPCFAENGSGAIVTTSRSVIYAFESGPGPWKSAVAEAAAKFADQIGSAVGLR